MKMCVKVTVTAAFLFLFSLSAHSQISVGLEGGWDNNRLHTSTGYRSFSKYERVDGFSIGIPVQYQLFDWLSVQTGVTYIQKNYKWSRTHYFAGVYQKSTNNYLQIPLMAHLSFGGSKLRGFVNAGGYAGYWISGKVKGVSFEPYNATDADKYGALNDYQSYSYNEKYAFNSQKDRRIELGWLLGGGLSYLLCKKYQVFAEYRYQYALTDQQKNYMIAGQIPRYNETGIVQIGCLYKLGRK